MARLHLDDAGENNGQAAAAQAHHRVDLVHGLDLVQKLGLDGKVQALRVGRLERCDFGDQRVHRRQELMQRRVNQANGRWAGAERLKDALEVVALERQQQVKLDFALFFGGS